MFAPTPNRIPIRELLIHALLCAVPLLFIFPGTFLRGELIWPSDILYLVQPWKSLAPEGFSVPKNPIMSDVLTAFHPYYRCTEEALKAGEWPLWNPNQCAGTPLLANCQSAVFYPPRLLHALGLSIPLATTIYVLLKVWLCGFTAYICGRKLGLGAWATRFLAAAWMLNSYSLYWANWPLTDVAAWVPLVFLCIEYILAGQYRRGIVGLGASGALLLLAGHPETAFTFAFGMGAYFVLRLAIERRWEQRLWRPVASAAAGWTLALLVCLPVLLPFVEYLLNSYTFYERHLAEFEETSLPVQAVLDLFIPRFFGTNSDYNTWGHFEANRHAIYAGVTVWIGAMLALAGARRGQLPKASVYALAGAAAFQMLLAFPTPYLMFIKEAPGLASLRQNYHIAFPLFAIALLGTVGIENWIRSRPPLRDLAWPLVFLAVTAGLVAVGWQFYEGLMGALKMTGYVGWQIVVAGIVAILSLALLLAGRVPRLGRPALAVLVLLLSADLVYAARGANVTVPRSTAVDEPALIHRLQNLEGAVRVEGSSARIPSGTLTARGIEEWLGYDGLFPMRVLRFARHLKKDLWNSMEPVIGLRYYLDDPSLRSGPLDDGYFPLDDPARFQPVGKVDGVTIYENKLAYPKTFFAKTYRQVDDIDAIFAELSRADYDPRGTVLTDLAPAEAPPEPGTGDPGSAAITRRTTTEVVVEATANYPAVLVVTDSYFPGWHAYLDGDRVEMFPAYTIFRGVVLPAGKHTITMRYEPWTFRVGMAASIATLAIGGGIILVSMFRGRRPNAQPAGADSAEAG
ncbi:MAG: YfhO family protein [Candidatus Hydrogenedentes bacterium]|nr:YfhO family protein [Candidatus Hydrogenedentota bacterium]